ncbi:ABC transporter ATP-binding protein [Mesoterricola sediminis]|uniref:Lipid A export permease/ATP-binding protein MsbA n=1 Tax=Mesoterricola sediminis TaxID=2927980 RepID=A0AA48H7K5_9BACT|nr:ABC transporter ATP-binding protein [Mesoterricola sediminis]BDU78811.1 lipid A export permease/ATP-binding protein MsbA [Mesoterricola sediminis]
MSSFGRFFREHLKRFLPLIASGSVLLALAGACHGAMIGVIQIIFGTLLGMGTSSGLDRMAGAHADKVGLLVSIKAWAAAHLPSPATLQAKAWILPAVLVAIFILKGIFTYAGTLIMVRSGIRATISLRERLFGHLLRQEPAFFQKHPVGELLQRCISDVQAVQGISSNQFADAVREITQALAMLSYVMYLNWRLSLTVFIAGPLVVFPIRKLSQRIRRINHRNMEASSRLLQRLKEVFSNIRVVLGFAREPFEEARFHEQNNELFRLGMKSARASAISHPIMELVGGLLLAGLLMFATRQIQAGLMDGPAFFGYILALYSFYDPIRRLTKLNAEIQVAQASLDRIYGMLDRETGMTVPADPRPVPENPARLAFEGVRFAYDGRNGRNEVLRGIDLQVGRGETVALVGGSGGGKTTLVNLVPRFFDPTEGRVTLDGTDLRDFDPRELRQRIGIVTQETLLFMDSVHENIAYGKEASREAVIEAARKAHAHDFIMALPKGYDTALAETGSTLSGGQRQRLAIARALLQDPPILLLDEATSALDTESERAVQEALEALMKDRTTLVIAHRLSTIQRATRICVLKGGEIVERGTHEELLALRGEYDRLHSLQFHD